MTGFFVSDILISKILPKKKGFPILIWKNLF